ncbi:MAG: KPN_02809 family neutral zinc metallopeptidase [bacterium]
MRWQGRRKSSNVQDRGGSAGGGLGGGAIGIVLMLLRVVFNKFGILGVVVLVGGAFLLSQMGMLNLGQLTGTGASTGGQKIAGSADPCNSGDQDKERMCIVLASTEDVWAQEFAKRNAKYPNPTLVFFVGGVDAGGCGYASSAVGPFYCPTENMLYLDTGFFKQLEGQLGAGGDFAQAYVIAHEVGHHIQNITGTLSEVQRAKQGLTSSGQNGLQVQVELQADCLAGVWAHYEDKMYTLDDDDIDEALTAAHAIGDDTLQKKAGRTPMPDSFTHGTSEQRMRWFKKGYTTGQMEACDTFNASAL